MMKATFMIQVPLNLPEVKLFIAPYLPSGTDFVDAVPGGAWEHSAN